MKFCVFCLVGIAVGVGLAVLGHYIAATPFERGPDGARIFVDAVLAGILGLIAGVCFYGGTEL